MATKSEPEPDEYERNTTKRYTGKLKWLDTEGIGYIVTDNDSSEVLVTPSSLPGPDEDGIRAVFEGDRVEFGLMTRRSNPCFKAIDVSPIGPQCYSCERVGHYANKCPVTYAARVECFRCGIVGHLARDCWASDDRDRAHNRVRVNGGSRNWGMVSTSSSGVGNWGCGGGDGDGRCSIGSSVVCVKRREDVKKVEAVEDCFVLEFDPRETGSRGRVVDDRKVNGGVLCVKKSEDVKEVEEVEDCFILEFDPTKIGSGGNGIIYDDYSDAEEEDDDDDCEEIKSIVCVKKVEDVKKVEEVEDCFILEFDPDEPVKFSNLSLCASTSQLITVEEDVCILAEKGQVACRDYPHPRHDCATFPFKKTSHEVHCKMCYCYICDVPAPCAHWTRGSMHCHATDEILMWRMRRDLEKNGKIP